MTQTASKDDVFRVITLVRGDMEQAGHYWCYVAVKPSCYEAFKKATAASYNIQNFVADAYGEIIVSGEGVDPDAEVTAQVAKLFNVTVDSLFTEADPLAAIDKLAQG